MELFVDQMVRLFLRQIPYRPQDRYVLTRFPVLGSHAPVSS